MPNNSNNRGKKGSKNQRNSKSTAANSNVVKFRRRGESGKIPSSLKKVSTRDKVSGQKLTRALNKLEHYREEIKTLKQRQTEQKAAFKKALKEAELEGYRKGYAALQRDMEAYFREREAALKKAEEKFEKEYFAKLTKKIKRKKKKRS